MIKYKASKLLDTFCMMKKLRNGIMTHSITEKDSWKTNKVSKVNQKLDRYSYTVKSNGERKVGQTMLESSRSK